jgi:hypothetical protein
VVWQLGVKQVDVAGVRSHTLHSRADVVGCRWWLGVSLAADGWQVDVAAGRWMAGRCVWQLGVKQVDVAGVRSHTLHGRADVVGCRWWLGVSLAADGWQVDGLVGGWLAGVRSLTLDDRWAAGGGWV